jgi:outer membrane protein TolC
LLLGQASAGSQTPVIPAIPAGREAGVSIQLAAESVLAHNPLLLLQQAQVDFSHGLLLAASASFDTNLSAQLSQTWTVQRLTAFQVLSDTSSGFNGTEERAAETFLTADLTRLLRNGINLDGHLQLERQLDNVVGLDGNNFFNFSIGASLPLLRNRGRRAVAAQETAAGLEVTASRHDLDQEASQLLSTMAASYWSLVASQQNLTIFQASEERARTYRANVQTLVDADQAPRSDLSQVEANLAQRAAQRVAAEQSVQAAEQQLAFDAGFSLERARSLSLHAADDFPAVPSAEQLTQSLGTVDSLLTLAQARRPDYLAAKVRITEEETLKVAARNGLLARLDLSGSAGYAGLRSGRKIQNFFDAVGAGAVGPNAQVALTFTFPVGNDAARGALQQVSAAQREAEYRIEQLTHQISQQVRTAYSGLLHAAAQHLEADREVQAAQAALDGEREKYRVGMGSIVDLVTLEDRLNTALGDQVQARLAYAQALVQLRFATDTLVDRAGDRLVLARQAFETVPVNPQ